MDWISVTSLALVDAINPCTLAIQIILLSSLLATKGRKSVLIGGILFSLSIYAMYFLYGVGILTFLYVLGIDWIIRYILKILLIVLAFFEILAYVRYKPGMVSMEMPLKLRPIAKKILSSVENPLIAIPAAILCSVLLLPCSSGPYAVMLMMIKTLNNFFLQTVAMIYYNFLFIIPMLLITFLIYFGTKPKKVMEWRNKHIKEIHLISGILLLLVFFLV
ncbi:MAG: hypothetical protein B6U78_01175 [Candidatus Aenigmarchaeota archaeon ex4484_224]|nr:MAG: hypothetical protein B6U78_01175 [Candidatus Aenigmarchaeota archaeon ex4484_224]